MLKTQEAGSAGGLAPMLGVTIAPRSRRPAEGPQKVVNDILRRRRFCSSECLLLAWAAEKIAPEFKAGRAPGIRDIIERVPVSSAINYVNVIHKENQEYVQE